MAEANPVKRIHHEQEFSHQIISELQAAEVHLKTYGSSSYGEVNSADTALGQAHLPGAGFMKSLKLSQTQG